MKANKMTNEMLAHNIEATIPFLMKEARHLTDADEIMTEAAKRLRALSTLTTHTDNSEVIAELQRRLKVAEDALTELQTRFVASVHDGTIDPYKALKIAEYALAAIRGERKREVTRRGDLALVAHHLAEALRHAKAQNMDAHFVAEIDHLVKQIGHIIGEECEQAAE